MSHVLFWPTVIFFYPVGNTSAVCLTENLPPESKADILLLACGDPRHILYTIYANDTNPLASKRAYDITCCDVDPAILARNALLFTLLADDGALNRLDNLWNIFYHMFLDQTSLAILVKQCRKLIGLAESLESWRAGPYSHFLAACDARTLAELRRMWTTYVDMANFSSRDAKQVEQRFVNGMKETSRRIGPGAITAAVRSAGPLILPASQAVSRKFSSYWASGVTNDGAQSQKRRNINPTFAFSIDGDKFAVHYGTDPLSGFHLAESFTSGDHTRPHDSIPPREVIRVAKQQFSRWCTSVSKRLKDSNPSSPTFVIRMFAGDALTFCQALKYCDVIQSPTTPYNVAAWRLSTITLDEHDYGPNAASPAPLSFNVIDTSNILDHLGLVNILVVTAPLLQKSPSATLYTEALLRTAENPSQAIHEHICGDLPTMALLLGVIPSTFVSQFTTRSNVHENLLMGGRAKQYHERLAWKAIGVGGPSTQHGSDDGRPPSRHLFFPPRELARFLFRVYLQMFSNEDMKSRFRQLFSLSAEARFQILQRSSILHYNRRSFALFVHFVKTRIQTDWVHTMNLLEGLVMSDGRLLMGRHAYQELCCHLHLLGVYTAEWMSIPALHRHHLEYERAAFGNSVGVFHNWTEALIPQVVTLALVVPRDAIARLEADFMDIGTPVLQCYMHEGPRQNCFAVTSATFGLLRVSGAGAHRTGVIIEGASHAGTDAPVNGTQPLWRTGAPLIITFAVPSASLMDFGRNPMATVGLALRATPGVSAKFTSRLGYDLTVFRTILTDPEHVFVLARAPIVGTSASTSGGGVTGVVAGSHWQENTSRALYAGDAATGLDTYQRTSEDVFVQMNSNFSAIQSFSVRVNVTDPIAQAALVNPHIILTVHSSSGSTRSLDVYVKIDVHTFPVRFPLPVDVSRTKLRVTKWLSCVEVIAPLAPFDVRPERDLSSKFAPLSLDTDDDGAPALGSIHRLNLDRCPTFKLPKGPPQYDWCDLHTSLMFSELEGKRAFRDRHKSPAVSSSITSTPDTLLHVKQTMHVLLHTAASATRDDKAPEAVFALCDMSRDGEVYLFIIVARMRLDVGSHTVVADAFVAPSTPLVRDAMDTAFRDAYERGTRKPDDVAFRFVATDADETAAWFHLIPRLTERCRTWSHKTNCAYHARKVEELEPDEYMFGVWEMRSPLCTCGEGVGTEILPKTFERVAPYLTRAALSPLFSVPYLKEVNAPLGSSGTSGFRKLAGWIVFGLVCYYLFFYRK